MRILFLIVVLLGFVAATGALVMAGAHVLGLESVSYWDGVTLSVLAWVWRAMTATSPPGRD